jgi:hypothetical protein
MKSFVKLSFIFFVFFERLIFSALSQVINPINSFPQNLVNQNTGNQVYTVPQNVSYQSQNYNAISQPNLVNQVHTAQNNMVNQNTNYMPVVQPGAGYQINNIQQNTGNQINSGYQVNNGASFYQEQIPLKDNLVNIIKNGSINLHNISDSLIYKKLDDLFNEKTNQFISINLKKNISKGKMEKYVRAFNAIWQLMSVLYLSNPKYNTNLQFISFFNLIGAMGGFNQYNDLGFNPVIIDFAKTIETNNKNNMVAKKQIFFNDNFLSNKENLNRAFNQFVVMYNLFILIFNNQIR